MFNYCILVVAFVLLKAQVIATEVEQELGLWASSQSLFAFSLPVQTNSWRAGLVAGSEECC